MNMRIGGVAKQSIVDGKGLRLTVFAQGCPHACAGCHNPGTHDFAGGYACEIDIILKELDKNPLLQGVTFSGGEPLCQVPAFLELARGVKARGKDIWCYTGYTLERLLEMAETDPALAELLPLVDVLVDGPFVRARRNLAMPFRGSENQRILDLPRTLSCGQAVELVL